MEINPDTLDFPKGTSSNEPSSQPLHLTNTTEQAMAYKIKTTAPKLYCVRPNASVIGPGERVEVTISRQGKEPSSESKHKDKFLVLSAPIQSDEDTENFAELWSAIEQSRADTIVNKKIRVHYEPSEQQQQQQQQPLSPGDDDANGQFAAESPQASAVKSASMVGAGSGAAGVAAAAASSGGDFSTPNKQDNSEISQAKQRISAMSDDLKKSPASGGGGDEKQPQAATTAASSSSNSKPSSSVLQPANGVPVPFVLLVALFSFLIGWRLF